MGVAGQPLLSSNIRAGSLFRSLFPAEAVRARQMVERLLRAMAPSLFCTRNPRIVHKIKPRAAEPPRTSLALRPFIHSAFSRPVLARPRARPTFWSRRSFKSRCGW